MSTFKFKQFEIKQDRATMKVNTDGILLGSWSQVCDKKHVLDIGTGTGVIAIMLAQRSSEIHVVGIDIDELSAEEASENMALSPFADRLSCVCIPLQDYADQYRHQYDLIVSNPPFFTGGTFSINENKNNVRHTVKLSHVDLLRSVRYLLAPNGHFDVVLPYIEGLRFIEMAEKYDLYPHRITEVIPKEGKPSERLLLSFTEHMSNAIDRSELIVSASDNANDYTAEFTALNKDYYLFM
jgi:tRNA1Val (adenine37-N6)-methyltransferase